MKVSLPNKSINCSAYGLSFDDKGICDSDQKIVQSLLDAELVVEVKTAKPKK